MIRSDQSGWVCTARRRVVMTIAVALVLVGLGGILWLTETTKPGQGSSHNALIALVPIYAALIPIYVAAWRRRNKKNV